MTVPAFASARSTRLRRRTSAGALCGIPSILNRALVMALDKPQVPRFEPIWFWAIRIVVAAPPTRASSPFGA